MAATRAGEQLPRTQDGLHDDHCHPGGKIARCFGAFCPQPKLKKKPPTRGAMALVTVLCAGLALDPTIRLNTPRGALFMPQVALGVWELTADEVEVSVKYGLEVGFEHIDAALVYKNGKAVGEAIRKYGSRDAVFLTSKVPGCSAPDVDGCARETARDFAAVLDELAFDHVDLMLLHFPPRPFHPLDCARIAAQWTELERAFWANKTRAIGVSNYCPSALRCLGGHITPAVNQVMFHVGMGRDPGGIASYCARAGIQLQSYSPLGDGRTRELISGPLVTSIGAENGRTGAQTALKWVVQRGAGLITKSTRRDHLAEDIDLYSWELSMEQMFLLNHATSPKGNYSFACQS